MGHRLYRKPYRQQQLLDAIQLALAKSEEDQKLKNSSLRFQVLLAQLTARQREVMDLMVVGKTNKSIAAELDLSIKTVEQHRSLVMRNMEVSSFSELVKKAIKNEGTQG